MIVHSLLLLFTFLRKKHRKSLLMLLFSNIGLAFLFDYYILGFRNMYNYKPYFLKKRSMDNVLGATLSQAIYVPFTSVMLTAYEANWKFKLGVAVYFALVEKWFVRMRVFKKQGWKTTYTLVLLPLYFFFSDKWWGWLRQGKQWTKKVTFFHVIHILWINALLPFVIRGSIHFKIGRFSTKKEIKLGPLYACCIALITTIATWVDGWVAKFFLVVGFILGDTWLIKHHYMKVKSKRHLFHPHTFIHILLVLLSSPIKHWVNGGKKRSSSS